MLLGLRVLGLRVLGLRVLGLRVLGLRGFAPPLRAAGEGIVWKNRGSLSE